PIVAVAEAGFGGPLHAFELMKAMIEAGAAGVHFEDQLAAAKKCGHLGGKVVVPTSEFIQKLVAARLAADVMGVRSLIVARTDANSSRLITSDADPSDHPLIGGERTPQGGLRDDRLAGTPVGGVRGAGARVPGDATPGVRRDRILRRRQPGHLRRDLLDTRDEGVDGTRADRRGDPPPPCVCPLLERSTNDNDFSRSDLSTVHARSPGDGERGTGGRCEVRFDESEAVRVVQGRREGVLSRQYLHPPGWAAVPRPTSRLHHPVSVAWVAVRRDVRERRRTARSEAGSIISRGNRGREGRR